MASRCPLRILEHKPCKTTFASILHAASSSFGAFFCRVQRALHDLTGQERSPSQRYYSFDCVCNLRGIADDAESLDPARHTSPPTGYKSLGGRLGDQRGGPRAPMVRAKPPQLFARRRHNYVMGQFACECTATGCGKDQCDWTDLYVAQFTLPDGSVVYVRGEYDTYGCIDCAVEGGGSAKLCIVDGAGGEDAQRFLTGTYQFGYFSTYQSGDDLAAFDGTGCGLKIKDEDMGEGVRLSIPADARDKLQAVIPAATAAKLGFRVTAGTPYKAHHRQSTLGREKTIQRIENYLRMDAAIKAKDQEAFDAAQREVLADLASVAHERYKIDSAMRRGIYTSAQKDALRQELAAAGVFLPPAPPAAQGPDDYGGWA